MKAFHLMPAVFKKCNMLKEELNDCHLGLNGRSIHTMSIFTALEELNSCHRRPSLLQGPRLVRLSTSFCLSTAFTEFNFGPSASGDTIVCGVVLSSYPPFTMFVTSLPLQVLCPPPMFWLRQLKLFFIFGFCQRLWWFG